MKRLETCNHAEIKYDTISPEESTKGRIFIGSINAAKDVEFLHSNAIATIINISDYEYDLSMTNPAANIKVHRFRFMDDSMVYIEDLYEIIDYLAAMAEIIDTTIIRGENILIHCSAGVNRSALTIGTYLVTRFKNYSAIIALLTAANESRNLPVLTNSLYRRILAELEYSAKFPGDHHCPREIISNLKNRQALVSNLRSVRSDLLGQSESCFAKWN